MENEEKIRLGLFALSLLLMLGVAAGVSISIFTTTHNSFAVLIYLLVSYFNFKFFGVFPFLIVSLAVYLIM